MPRRPEGVSGLDIQQVQVDKKLTSVSAVDPATFGPLWRFDWLGGGSDALLQELGTTKALVEQQTAASLGLKTGQKFTMTTVDGKQVKMTMAGEYKDPMLLSGIVITQQRLRTGLPAAGAVHGVREERLGDARTPGSSRPSRPRWPTCRRRT